MLHLVIFFFFSHLAFFFFSYRNELDKLEGAVLAAATTAARNQWDIRKTINSTHCFIIFIFLIIITNFLYIKYFVVYKFDNRICFIYFFDYNNICFNLSSFARRSTYIFLILFLFRYRAFILEYLNVFFLCII